MHTYSWFVIEALNGKLQGTRLLPAFIVSEEYSPNGLRLRVVLKIFPLHCNGQAVGGHKPFKETFDPG